MGDLKDASMKSVGLGASEQEVKSQAVGIPTTERAFSSLAREACFTCFRVRFFVIKGPRSAWRSFSISDTLAITLWLVSRRLTEQNVRS